MPAGANGPALHKQAMGLYPFWPHAGRVLICGDAAALQAQQSHSSSTLRPVGWLLSRRITLWLVRHSQTAGPRASMFSGLSRAQESLANLPCISQHYAHTKLSPQPLQPWCAV